MQTLLIWDFYQFSDTMDVKTDILTTKDYSGSRIDNTPAKGSGLGGYTVVTNHSPDHKTTSRNLLPPSGENHTAATDQPYITVSEHNPANTWVKGIINHADTPNNTISSTTSTLSQAEGIALSQQPSSPSSENTEHSDNSGSGEGEPPEPPIMPSSTGESIVDSRQQHVDQLVDAAAQGDVQRLINGLTQPVLDLSLLTETHSKTGDTALHAAIENRQEDSVATIIGILQRCPENRAVEMKTLLGLANKNNQTPLELGEISPAIKTELLASLSKEWPFCVQHEGFMVIPFQRGVCACSVCEPCSLQATIADRFCKACNFRLRRGDNFPDPAKKRDTRTAIHTYKQLFDRIPQCAYCLNPAFPPKKTACGHVACDMCFTNEPQQPRLCQAIDGNTCCYRPLEPTIRDDGICATYIHLFSSKPKYDDASPIGQQILQALGLDTNAYRQASPQPSTEECPTVGKSKQHPVIKQPDRPEDFQWLTVEVSSYYPHRCVLPAQLRKPKSYHSHGVDSLEIEELEYRLIPAGKIAKKLETARQRAYQQQLNEKPKTNEPISYFADCKKKLPLSENGKGSFTLDKIKGKVITLDYEVSQQLPNVAIAHSIGRRDKMEDAHSTERFTFHAAGKTYTASAVCIYDGHRGKKCSTEAAKRMIPILSKWLSFFNQKELSDEGILNSMKIAPVEFSRTYDSNKDGATANIILFLKNTAWIANLGDSRTILVESSGKITQLEKSCKITQLSEDAKPDIDIFADSIYKRGGFEENARVNGILAPGRSLADHYLDGALPSRVKITQQPLEGITGCLLQVCDGLTDVATTYDLGIEVLRHLNSLVAINQLALYIVVNLVMKTFMARSKDNLSAAITLLPIKGM
ncbi:PP2C family serine/threonine-protein phosphatase [Kistimonas asteriae]|uniref:PP2C family serine/threonine-protein phosphatase n=1 Tax=Kistimonas asteriae TaxID=517724 RepID=UPI001BA4465F|nr:PP2C family protein-serine/threonine phosphatase [Kistimonas asteriae]